MVTIDKAVYLEDLGRVRDVVELLERTYPGAEWTGALVFIDGGGGLILVACFDPVLYPGERTEWEALFPARDLRALTLRDACAARRRYRPLLAEGVVETLAHIKLLP